MALTFAKKKPASADTDTTAEKKAHTAAGTQSKTASNASHSVGFLKKGASMKQAFENEEAKAEAAKEAAGKMRRFWLKEEESSTITFLDGQMDESGQMLDIFAFYEHAIQLNGEWSNFVCTAEADQSQPCPICEAGDKPSFVGVMTVLDHKPYTVKNGPNAGTVLVDQRKLFVAKRDTIKLLTNLAKKRGGLAGCTFDVTRSGDKKARVGDVFDFQHKYSKLSEIAAKYDLKMEDVQPAEYAEEIIYHSPEDLIKLGVGKAKFNGGGNKTSSGKGYKDEL